MAPNPQLPDLIVAVATEEVEEISEVEVEVAHWVDGDEHHPRDVLGQPIECECGSFNLDGTGDWVLCNDCGEWLVGFDVAELLVDGTADAEQLTLGGLS